MHTDKMEVDVNTCISKTNSFVLPDKFEPATNLKLLIFAVVPDNGFSHKRTQVPQNYMYFCMFLSAL